MAKNLNTKQVMAGFGVSDMTVWSWRQGTPTKDALPHTVVGRNVTFDEAALKAWGKKYGLTWNAAAASAVGTATSGPKAKAAPVKKVAAKKAAAKVVPIAQAKKAKAKKAEAAAA